MASDDVPYVELEIPARYKMKRALKGEDDSLKYLMRHGEFSV